MANIDKVTATLMRHKPSKVVAFVNDKERDIAVPNVRKKWARVVATLDGLGAWSHVELRDKGGALLTTIENTDPAGELADLGQPTGKAAEVERLLAVVLKAQREAMAFKNEETQGLLRAQGEVVRELVAGVSAMRQVQTETLQAMRELGKVRMEAAIAAAQGEEGGLEKLLEPLLPVLAPMLGKLLGGGDAPPSNGVRPKPGHS